MDKKVLFVVYQSPVGSIWINEAFRTAFGMYGEDIEPAVMVMKEAVTGISADTKPESLGLLPIKIVQRFIKRYETPVYALKEDVERYHVKNIDENYQVQMISEKDLSDFLHDFDYVIFM
ncbi:intracellular sulfur oxidation protein [Marinitoga sp. 1135]|uniref:intracellular sulfur oxidation protein n=1 Tax=unclassified Marinitoga TaxID=2640159 RepID=UPI0009506B41|nr:MULTISPECIES: intracellular sulfur oxidation protein [unclassified Marinitoga]APT74980.1 intracellular sulfur oxidation protein [Marinitoga sp. 1137]NUU94736.1 intracellular sulfur oxidation protein [Marinitoga sp. 1135]NUU96665.1 intracellular sulfur oxidation protein [Marinitoga sp. 1138]